MTPRDQEIRERLVAALPALRRFTRALTRHAADADDLAQAAIARALDRAGQYAPGTRFEAWLFRIARNLWLDQLRRRKVRGPAIGLEAAEHAADAPGAGAAERQLLLVQTMAAFDALPEPQREVAALVLLEGFAYQEAADILAIPLGTVMSRLHRARRTLAERLLGPEADPDPAGARPS